MRFLSRLREDAGTALVEYALVMPLLLLLVFGMLDFGRAFNYWIDTTHLANEGARWAVVNYNPGAGTLQEYVKGQANTVELRDGEVGVRDRGSYPQVEGGLRTFGGHAILEHVEHPDGFIATAWGSLRPGGWLILTMACAPRPAHSGVDGNELRPGEHYRNVDPDLLARWLAGWKDTEIEAHSRGDLYAVARKPD